MQDEDGDRREEIKVRRFWDLSQDIFCIVSFNDLIRDVNPAFQKILGYSRDEVLGKPITNFIHPEDIEPTLTAGLLLLDGRFDRIFENRFRTKDGSYRWLLWSAIPILEENLSYSTARDVTEHRQAREALEKSEEKYRSLFNHMTESFAVHEIIFDGQGRPVDYIYRDANPAFEKVTGLSPEKVINRRITEILPGVESFWIETFGQVAVTGQPVLFEKYATKTKKWLEIYAYSLGNNLVADFRRDITDRKKADETLAKAKEELEIKVRERTAELSRTNKRLKYYLEEVIQAQEKERKRIALELHDDTAPSLAYLGMELDAVITRNPHLPLRIKNSLQGMRQKLNNTQQDIRRFSHELHPSILDNLGLEAALETLCVESNSSGGPQVEFEVSGDEKPLIETTKLALYRIAQEALNNIRKHSRANKALISLEYGSENVRLSVADNGKGFNPSRPPGKGLGITGMKERANLVGAELIVESRPKKGTRVSVEIKI